MQKDLQSHPRYSLKQLDIRTYRGIGHVEITDLPKGAPWIFITGPNGYGKTCLLQALFLALEGNQDGQTILVLDKNYVIEATFWNNHDTYYFCTKEPENQPKGNPKGIVPLAAYGPSRLTIQGSISANKEVGISSLSYSLFNSDGILLNIEPEIVKLEVRSRVILNDPSSSEEIKSEARRMIAQRNMMLEALRKLAPNIKNISTDTSYDKLMYTEKANPSVAKTFSQLAYGDRSIIAMVGDMLIRLLKKQPDINALEDLQGVVLIDELDLHLHVSWQKQLPSLLSAVFPGVQFIVTTHSAIPILGAPEGSVFLTLDRNEDEAITLHKIDIEVANLTPNLIFSSEIFDFQDIIPTANKNLMALRTEDTLAEAHYRDRIRQELQQFLDSGGELPKNLFK